MTRISVFGLGYVGCVTATCLAAEGHSVVGVDINADKVQMVQSGLSPIVEVGLDILLAEAVASGSLRATSDTHWAIQNTDMALICVGTPSAANGSLSLSALQRVSREIGTALREREQLFTVVFRSTVLPGTVEDELLPLLAESSQKCEGVYWRVAYNPEFLREGTAVHDFYNPPKIVFGGHESYIQDVAAIYNGINAPLMLTSLRMAEMIKYADNAYHALKVAFANEIGSLCQQEGIDGYQLMELFCQDRKLNISSAYLMPGFAFGGSCLPKDLRALTYLAKDKGIEVPILDSILDSNQRHKHRALKLILATGKRRVSVLGLSFKPGTDDLRESPTIELVEFLIGKGLDVRVYDSGVSLSRLVGANRDYIEKEIPHISSLLVPSIEDALQHAEVIVRTHNTGEFLDVSNSLSEEQILVDLVRQTQQPNISHNYRGICW